MIGRRLESTNHAITQSPNAPIDDQRGEALSASRCRSGAGQIGAVVLAAGRSTRFRSARSKLVHELGGRPIIAWLLGALRAVDVAPVVVVVAPEADERARRLRAGRAVRRADRAARHRARRAGGARRRCAASTAASCCSTATCRCCAPTTLRRLIETHRAERRRADAADRRRSSDPHGWGRIVRERGARARHRRGARCQRRPSAPIREVNVGVYCVRAPLLFDAAAARDARQRTGRDLSDRHRRPRRRAPASRSPTSPVDVAEVGADQLARRAGSDGEDPARADQREVDGGRRDAGGSRHGLHRSRRDASDATP